MVLRRTILVGLLLAAVLPAAVLPATAQFPDLRDLLRIFLPRQRVEMAPAPPSPPSQWNGSREQPGSYQVLTLSGRQIVRHKWGDRKTQMGG